MELARSPQHSARESVLGGVVLNAAGVPLSGWGPPLAIGVLTTAGWSVAAVSRRGRPIGGGRSEELTSLLKDRYREGSSLDEVVSVAASSLAEVEHTAVDVANLEAAVLDRTRGRRKFHRLTDQELDGMVSARR